MRKSSSELDVRATLALFCALGCASVTAESVMNLPEGQARIIGDTIAEPLTAGKPDPARGRDAFLDTERGHCLRCHQVASINAPFQGTLGPDLTRVGDRLSAAQLRLRLIDASRVNPNTVMPPYHRVHGLHQVGARYQGRPILTAAEIEDVVAYLVTLEGDRG
jgi:sulfur-oxidizing protein SoxX